jgi:hypothetical protein
MDVETAITLASTAAGSAATEAGRSAWESLVSLARRITGRPANPEDPASPEETEADRDALVGRIAEHARADDGFAAQLCQWAAEHRASLQLTRDESAVHNTISSGARVTGTVIQARDIHGGITIGGGDPDPRDRG